MGMAELKVTMAILRKTLGWQKKSDKISLTQLEKMTGLSRQGVIDGTREAEARGTVRRIDGPITEWVVNVVDQPKPEVVKPVDQPSQASRPKLVKPVDTQKKERNIKEKSSAENPRAPTDSLFPIAQAIAKVCRMNLQANSARIFREAKLLSKATPTPTPELIEQHYNGNSAAFWRSHDWRGQKGNAPTPSAIRETWGRWIGNKEKETPDL